MGLGKAPRPASQIIPKTPLATGAIRPVKDATSQSPCGQKSASVSAFNVKGENGMYPWLLTCGRKGAGITLDQRGI
jgi:hypothetical protein